MFSREGKVMRRLEVRRERGKGVVLVRLSLDLVGGGEGGEDLTPCWVQSVKGKKKNLPCRKGEGEKCRSACRFKREGESVYPGGGGGGGCSPNYSGKGGGGWVLLTPFDGKGLKKLGKEMRPPLLGRMGRKGTIFSTPQSGLK